MRNRTEHNTAAVLRHVPDQWDFDLMPVVLVPKRIAYDDDA